MTTVVIAGGGTAGHVVPGLAIARALVRRGLPDDEILWVGSARGMEVVDVPAAGFELVVLPGRGLERRPTPANVANGLAIARAVPMARSILRSRRPRVVVSLGGYAAVPAGVAARSLRIPIVVQEQNAVPSLANRLVGRAARYSAVPVAGTGLRNEVVTGNPLREEIRCAVGADQDAARNRLGIPPRRRCVLVFGGSLGSRRINQATFSLARAWRARDDVAIHHVIGRRDWESAQDDIRASATGALHYRAVEYEDDMATALTAADVAVTRAGGMTVSELAALGVPAVLVPLPIAPNDAQRHNAAALASAGAAVVVADHDLDGDRMAAELDALLGSDLAAARAAAAAVGRPDAADHVARLIEAVLA